MVFWVQVLVVHDLPSKRPNPALALVLRGALHVQDGIVHNLYGIHTKAIVERERVPQAAVAVAQQTTLCFLVLCVCMWVMSARFARVQYIVSYSFVCVVSIVSAVCVYMFWRLV